MIWLLTVPLTLAQPAYPDSSAALRAGEVNVDHYYNLGLELEAQEELALAALCYERGLMLAPHDTQAQERLATLGAVPDHGALLAPKLTGWLAVLALAGALLSLAAWRLQAKPGWALAAAPLALLGVTLAGLTQAELSRWGTQALVLEDSAVTSQAGGGQALFELSALERVEIVAEGEGSVQIQTSDARVGWMSEAALGVLDPRAEPPLAR